MKQVDPEIHVPWLDHANAELDSLNAAPAQTDQSDPRTILSEAIELAKKGFDRPRTVGAPASPFETSRDERAQEKGKLDKERIEPLRQQFEAVLKVGAAYYLEQLLTRLRQNPTEGLSVENVQKALCFPTQKLPALVAAMDPLAELPKPEQHWVTRVRRSLEYWNDQLGNAFAPQPWERDAWNHAWASSAALTFFDWMLHKVHRSSELGDFDYWQCLIAALKDPRILPLGYFRTSKRGTLSCLPTDKTSKLDVQLQISPWLAFTLDTPNNGNSVPLVNHELRAISLKLYKLGDRSNSDKHSSNGLQIGHVYLAIFIQRMAQRIEPEEVNPMNFQRPIPPAQLPADLHDSRSGDWGAQLMGIAMTQKKALAAHRSRTEGRVVSVEHLMAKSGPRFNTRRPPPTNAIALPSLRPLDAETLEWEPPPEPESDSLGSVCLKALTLGNGEPPQYADCSVIVKLNDRWYAIYPELWEDDDEENDEESERVVLHAYAPLPPALKEVGGWPRLAAAMPDACWVVHFRGLGMLLLAALDLDIETRFENT